MKIYINKLAFRLTLWFLLLSIIPIMVLILFIQSNITTLILDEYKENLDNRLQYVLNSLIEEDNSFDANVILAQFGTSTKYYILSSDLTIIQTNQTIQWNSVYRANFSETQINAIENPNTECHILDQSKTYFCTAAIHEINGTLIVIKDAQRIITNINRLHEKSILQIAISLLLIAIAAGVIIWIIVGKPISLLTHAAVKIGNGDFSTIIETNEMNDELAVLGNTFNHTTQQLSILNKSQKDKINELNKVKIALEKSQENLRAFFHSINDFVFVIDQQEVILYTNQQVETQLDYHLADMLGKKMDTLFIRNRQYETGSLFNYLPNTSIHGYLVKQNGEKIEAEMKLSEGQWNEQNVLFGIARDITEHIKSENEIKKQIQRMESLHKIDLAITGTMDMNITMKVLLNQVNKQLNMVGSSMVLFDSISNQLQYYTEEGFKVNNFQTFATYIGEGLAGKAAFERKLIITRSVKFTDKKYPPYLDNYEFETVYDMPLIAKGELKGILELYSNKPPVDDADWHNYLATLATQAALAIDNTQLFNNLQRTNTELYLAYDITLEGLVKTLELRDLESCQHSERTTDMIMASIKQFNFRESQIPHIRRGAILHDIGKMGIPDQILNKPGPLNEDEWIIIKKHPVIAYDLISKIPFLRPALPIPYCHHERWDGSGYPRGLSGEQIPLEARVFSVIDVWDALTHDCVYRKAWSYEETIQYIQDHAGTQFDPQVVQLFLNFIQQYQYI